MKRILVLALVLISIASSTQRVGADTGSSGKIRVLLIDGQNNHNWRATSPILKKIIEAPGRFTLDVTSNLKPNDKPGEIDKTVPFPPDLSKYDVVLSNYNGQPWAAEFNKSLEDNLKEGKIALVIVHAANNSFGGWNEYRKMVGMGWYGKNTGERLYLDDQGKSIKLPVNEGDGPGHRYTGPFKVILRDAEHPVTKGMPAEWMHDRDELYDNMRGPIENIHLLASAYSKGTMKHEPMIWTISYGKGRVFHTPMGHDVQAMKCVGFAATVQRGTEWAATGKVTIPLPADFPTADKISTVK